MSSPLPGGRAARAWMKHVRLWSERGEVPSVPDLVRAERYATASGTGSVGAVAACLVLRARRLGDASFEGFVAHGAAWFEGSVSDRRRLFAAAAHFLAEERPSRSAGVA